MNSKKRESLLNICVFISIIRLTEKILLRHKTSRSKIEKSVFQLAKTTFSTSGRYHPRAPEVRHSARQHPRRESEAIPLTRPPLEVRATVRLRDFIPPEATLISAARVIGVLLTPPALYCYEWFCGSFLGTQFSTVRNPRIEFTSRKCLYLNGFLFMSTPLLGTKISLKLPTNKANTVAYLLTGPLLGPLSGPLCQVCDQNSQT